MASLFRRALKTLGLLPARGPLVHALPIVSFSPRRGSRQVLLAYREIAWLRTVVDTVAEAVATGARNDLMDRLAADPAFGRLPAGALAAELEPARYVGRSPEQVDEFLAEYWTPLRARAAAHAATAERAEVAV